MPFCTKANVVVTNHMVQTCVNFFMCTRREEAFRGIYTSLQYTYLLYYEVGSSESVESTAKRIYLSALCTWPAYVGYHTIAFCTIVRRIERKVELRVIGGTEKMCGRTSLCRSQEVVHADPG
eukprot:scaffold54300_cov49-Attheya_sp.AAC.4